MPSPPVMLLLFPVLTVFCLACSHVHVEFHLVYMTPHLPRHPYTPSRLVPASPYHPMPIPPILSEFQRITYAPHFLCFSPLCHTYIFLTLFNFCVTTHVFSRFYPYFAPPHIHFPPFYLFPRRPPTPQPTLFLTPYPLTSPHTYTHPTPPLFTPHSPLLHTPHLAHTLPRSPTLRSMLSLTPHTAPCPYLPPLAYAHTSPHAFLARPCPLFAACYSSLHTVTDLYLMYNHQQNKKPENKCSPGKQRIAVINCRRQPI